MNDFRKLRTFLLRQFLPLLLLVVICTTIMSIVSYQILQDKMVKWLYDNNNKVLKQFAKTIDNLIVSNSNEIYIRILNDMSKDDRMKYYLMSPLKNNMIDTLFVYNYLLSIKESSPYILSVEVFYVNNSLLISSDKIIYDLFYSFRSKELQPYVDLLKKVDYKNDQFDFVSNASTISMLCPVVSGKNIKALVIIKYSSDILREHLLNTQPPEFDDIIVVDEKGTVVFNMDGLGTIWNPEGDERLFKAINEKNTDGSYTMEMDGELNIVSFINYGINNWKYIAITPLNIYLEPISYILNNLLISVLITVFVGLILIIAISLWQSKPMFSIVKLCYTANVTVGEKSDTYGIIQETLTGMMKTIETKNQEISNIMPVLRNNFILWFLSEMPTDADEIEDQMLLMQISFPYKNFCVLAVKAVSIQGEPCDDDGGIKQEYALTEAKLRFETLLNTESSFCSLCKKDVYILGLANFDFTLEYFNILCDGLSMGAAYGYNIYLCTSSIVQSIAEAAGIIKYVMNGLQYSYIYPEKSHLTTEMTQIYEKKRLYNASSYLKSFISSLKLKEYGRCLSEIDILINKIRSDGCCMEDVNTIINSLGYEIDSISGIYEGLRNKFIKYDLRSADILTLRSNLYRFIADLQVVGSKANDSSIDRLVTNAKKYIMRNPEIGQLSLQSVADALNISATYLSHVFSEKEGITFIDYITHVKMEYSQQLLIDTELSLNEISNKLGYASPQYFISRFKKHFNTTPSVYRKKHGVVNNID